MDEKMINDIKACGIEYEDTLHRFMNKQDMMVKFLKKFPEDANYSQMVENIDKRDYKMAFRNAHTLKGVVANLGIQSLYSHVSEITELLRDREEYEVDQQRLTEELMLLNEKYVEVCTVIRRIDSM
ncbi:MAG: Hpt domain-containing protein [Lachnospiraceae bacterium]|nr:Hpt domain-containing protein [Lachnospiraceae bacterium]